jgi:microcystin-dependent protein
MSDPFLAEIRILPFNFAPKGWALCNGQLLSIAQNTALFSLLGTNYGGDGRVNFGLPNLQGGVPVHVGSGQGPGLSPYVLGQSGGEAAVTLLTSEMPSHGHALAVTAQTAAQSLPGSSVGLGKSNGGLAYSNATSGLVAMSPQSVGVDGGSTPHNNLMPYLVLSFCIALQGIYPARS